MTSEKILRKLIEEMTLQELKFNTRWMSKSIRTVLPVFGFDPYMIWNRSYNDSFTKRRLEAIENVLEAFKKLWVDIFHEQVDIDTAELAYRHAAKYWRAIWTAAGKDEQIAKKRMLKKLYRLYILPVLKKQDIKEKGAAE